MPIFEKLIGTKLISNYGTYVRKKNKRIKMWHYRLYNIYMKVA